MARGDMSEAGWNEPVTVTPQGAEPGGEQDIQTNGWNAAVLEQQRELQARDDEETRQYGEKMMADFDNLIMQGKQKRAERRRMQDATLSTIMLQARNGDGFVPPDVLDAASENMGFRVAGGNFVKSTGDFVLYSQDQNGKMIPVAVATPEMQFQTLSRAKMGLDYQREIYGNMSRRLTPEQLAKRGFTNPDAPQTVGSTTISGSTARRVFGMGGPERRGISSFSADGKGGFTRTQTGPDGVTAREDFGTRDQNDNGRWKLLSSGPDGKRYENSKTGHVVTVRDGELAPWEQSDKTRVAQINAKSQSERDAAKIKAQKDVAEINAASRMLFRNSGGKTSGGNSMKEIVDALSKMQTHLNENGAGMSEEERQQMQQAIKAGFAGLVSWFSPQQQTSGGNEQGGPQVSDDGMTMKLMDGRTIRKNQEFEVAGKNGEKKKFVWLGGEAKNVKPIE